MLNPVLMNRNNTAIYCRLSVEDGDINESQSINNQKNILTKYCLEHNFNVYNIYIDDGYSGTNFDRPGFISLRNDIDSGLIDIVITKDLSRLGRDYLEVGKLLERYFPDNNIRYIALSDNIDTIGDLDDFIPFKNIINEFYAKDISKKIRATQKFQRESGLYRNSGVSLYGYMDDEGKRRIINPETAPNVVLIFNLFIKGYSLKGICDYLYEHKIKSPSAYSGIERKDRENHNPYIWIPKQIEKIIKNTEYLGHYIKGKSTSRFKSKKKINIKEENRYVFKDRFDPIISKEIFDLANSMISGNKQNSGLTNPYQGIVYCGICGKPLRIQRHKDSKGHYEERLTCSNIGEIGKGSILINDLNEIIQRELYELKNIILNKKEEFVNLALNRINEINIKMPTSEYKAKMIKIERRINDINNYIKNLFEDSIKNGLPEDSYKKLLDEYLSEKNILEIEYKKLELLDEDNKSNNNDLETKLESFINSIDNMDDNNILSPIILRNIISKIMITTFKQEENKNILGKNVIIYYKALDPLIKEFIGGSHDK